MLRLGLALLLLVVAVPAADAATVRILPGEVRVRVADGVRWTLAVEVSRGGGGRVVRRARGRGPRTVRYPRRTLRGCGAAFVQARLRAGAGTRTLNWARAPRCPYRAGAAVRDIAPRPEDGEVFLGGYGLGGSRPSAGTAPGGLQARAVAISAGEETLVLADVEVQGWFAAHAGDALALGDVRRAVARRWGLDPSQVVVQSNHTHSGPDLLGAWGGASAAYRQRVFDQTVGVIGDAIRRQRGARLVYGVADGTDLLSNQFAYDPPNRSLDGEVRVLQARGPAGRPAVTVLNFSAHATVLGADNDLASGDWTTHANALLERRLGGRAVTLMGTLGRTQPADGGTTVDGYAARVADRAQDALAAAERLSGPPSVAARSYLIQDLSENPAILGLNYAGGAVDAQLVRSTEPPWLSGAVLGTTTTTARIGDVLLLGVPGEAYPQIPLAVREAVPGLRGYMTMGLANDQLGYLIAPLGAYPETSSPRSTTTTTSSTCR